MRLKLHPTHPEPRKIRMAVEALRDGEVIAYPTDSVYAFGADATQKRAVERVYRIKGLDDEQPMAFVVPDLSDIARYAQVDNQTYRTLRRLTPGPYCFILKATREAPKRLVMKRKTVGIRVPNHPVAQALVRELGVPLVSTSVVWENEILQDPEDIETRFRNRGLHMVLDVEWGGLVPSTVVDLSEGAVNIVRAGAGATDDLT